MLSRLVYGFAVLLLLVGATIAFASIQSSHGPIPSSTGAPAVGGKPDEWNCTLCHYAGGDNLNTPGGAVQILNAPAVYTPGQSYALTVRLNSDSTAFSATRLWGFQITAVRASDGTGVGTFVLPDPDSLQILMGEGMLASRAYVEHTSLGTRSGLGGPVQWTFSWQAPPSAAGTIYFFCSANAADGTGDSGNDYVYTARDTTLPPGSVGVVNAIASRTTLALPTPNPARGPVALGYSLAVSGRMELAIYDLQGRQVRRLVSGWREAGPGNARWDGRRDDGTIAANGTYFARLATSKDAQALTRKITIGR